MRAASALLLVLATQAVFLPAVHGHHGDDDGDEDEEECQRQRNRLFHLLLRSSSALEARRRKKRPPTAAGTSALAPTPRDRVVEAMLGSFDPLLEHIRRADPAIFPPRRRLETSRAAANSVKVANRRAQGHEEQDDPVELRGSSAGDSNDNKEEEEDKEYWTEDGDVINRWLSQVANRRNQVVGGRRRQQAGLGSPPATFYQLHETVSLADKEGGMEEISHRQAQIPLAVEEEEEEEEQIVSPLLGTFKPYRKSTMERDPAPLRKETVVVGGGEYLPVWKARWSTQRPFIAPLPVRLLATGAASSVRPPYTDDRTRPQGNPAGTSSSSSSSSSSLVSPPPPVDPASLLIKRFGGGGVIQEGGSDQVMTSMGHSDVAATAIAQEHSPHEEVRTADEEDFPAGAEEASESAFSNSRGEEEEDEVMTTGGGDVNRDGAGEDIVQRAGQDSGGRMEEEEEAYVTPHLRTLLAYLSPSGKSGDEGVAVEGENLYSVLESIDVITEVLQKGNNIRPGDLQTSATTSAPPPPTTATATTTTPRTLESMLGSLPRPSSSSPFPFFFDPATRVMSRIRSLPLRVRRRLLSHLVSAVPLAAASMASAGVPEELMAPLAAVVPGFLEGAFGGQ